jgi:hypothetical protein
MRIGDFAPANLPIDLTARVVAVVDVSMLGRTPVFRLRSARRSCSTDPAGLVP